MTRLAFVSDTHCLHGRLTQSLIEANADILVHSGDFTANNMYENKKSDEIEAFGEWCAMLVRKNYVKHVVAVAGNHDVWFDSTPVPEKTLEAVETLFICIMAVQVLAALTGYRFGFLRGERMAAKRATDAESFPEPEPNEADDNGLWADARVRARLLWHRCRSWRSGRTCDRWQRP